MVTTVLSWVWLLPAMFLMVVVHELAHMFTARHFRVRVLEVGFGFGPSLYRHRHRGIEYTLNVLPLGGFVRLDRDGVNGIARLSIWRQAAVLCSGIALNVVMGVGMIMAVGFLPSNETHGRLLVREVIDGSPAGTAGVMAGDVILAIDGHAITSLSQMRERNWLGADTVVYRLARGADVRDLALSPEHGRIGVFLILEDPVVLRTSPGISERFATGAGLCWDMAMIPLMALLDLLAGSDGAGQSVAGPGDVVALSSEAVLSGGWAMAVIIAGGLSLHLGLLNLLPIPGLDGGQLLFLAIGGVRRRPIPSRLQHAANMLGLAFLLALVTAVILIDLYRSIFP